MRCLPFLTALTMLATMPASGLTPTARPGVEAVRSLQPGVRLSQLKTMWGEAYRIGHWPNLVMFHVPDDLRAETFIQIWVSVSSRDPEAVERVLMLDNTSMMPEFIEIFNRAEITRHRRCDQIRLADNRWARIADIDANWGHPDMVYGSGLTYWSYTMEDGGTGSWVDIQHRKHPGMVVFNCSGPQPATP